MYFPYLRGKQNELILLDDCRELIRSSGQIVPILEPVKSSLGNLTNKFLRYVDANIPIILIVNPNVGELTNDKDSIFDRVVTKLNERGKSHILGYIISEETSRGDIAQFLQRSKGNRVCFIHGYEYPDPDSIKNLPNLTYQIFLSKAVGITYRKGFMGNNNVIIEDGFTSRQKNALYPSDEKFLDINLKYMEDHYIGFGDYLIVGSDYREKGGPAHAVVIHITYQKQSGEIGIRHFVSDRTTTILDTPGKFAEALSKLVQEKNKKGTLILNTHALEIYQLLHNKGNFPGLGVVKKLSMEHHLELISKMI